MKPREMVWACVYAAHFSARVSPLVSTSVGGIDTTTGMRTETVWTPSDVELARIDREARIVADLAADRSESR